MFHFRQNVGAQNDRVVAGQGAEQFADLDDLLGVEAGSGLVEDEYVGVVDDRLGDADALPVALGKLADQLVAHVADGAASQHLVHPAVDVRRADSLELADEIEVLGDLHLGVNRRCFRQIPDPLLDLHGVLEHVEAGDIGRSRRGRQEAGQDPHGGGLPGAIGPEEADDLPLFDFKGDIVYGDRAGVSLG